MRKPLLLITLFVGIITGCNEKTQKEGLQGKLVIFHAGSLTIPIRALADTFNLQYPDLKIQPESAGSLTSIRKITDLKRPCDILASADYLLIDKLMIPEYTSWNLKFAINEMSLVYHEKSKYANRITNDNWHEILMQDNVRYGRADPSSDPCGYRTILTLKLYEKVKKQIGLAEKILNKDNRFIRPKEVDLLGLLESQTIDYIFIYKSVALQHGLKYINLPDSIDLSSQELASWYNEVSVEIKGNAPTEIIIQQGEPMIYGITIPNNASNIEAAKEFMRFITSDRGRRIIKENYQTPITKIELSNKSIPPDWLL